MSRRCKLRGEVIRSGVARLRIAIVTKAFFIGRLRISIVIEKIEILTSYGLTRFLNWSLLSNIHKKLQNYFQCTNYF